MTGPAPKPTWRVIFVCSGNICRSPMAEAIASTRLAQESIGAQLLSMGTLGIFGRPASELAQLVCREHGIDLTAHSSQGVSFGLLQSADLVAVMETAHRDFLLAGRPDLKNIRLFSGFDPDSGPTDVADPIGGTREDYEHCFARLVRGVDGIIGQLRLGLLV